MAEAIAHVRADRLHELRTSLDAIADPGRLTDEEFAAIDQAVRALRPGRRTEGAPPAAGDRGRHSRGVPRTRAQPSADDAGPLDASLHSAGASGVALSHAELPESTGAALERLQPRPEQYISAASPTTSPTGHRAEHTVREAIAAAPAHDLLAAIATVDDALRIALKVTVQDLHRWELEGGERRYGDELTVSAEAYAAMDDAWKRAYVARLLTTAALGWGLRTAFAETAIGEPSRRRDDVRTFVCSVLEELPPLEP